MQITYLWKLTYNFYEFMNMNSLFLAMFLVFCSFPPCGILQTP